MEKSIEKAQRLLLKYKQDNVLRFMNNLENNRKEELANQILHINFEKLQELYNKTKEDIYTDLEEILPIKAINPNRIPKENVDNYLKAGESLIKQNKYAVVTMAGGQGTRLRT